MSKIFVTLCLVVCVSMTQGAPQTQEVGFPEQEPNTEQGNARTEIASPHSVLPVAEAYEVQIVDVINGSAAAIGNRLQPLANRLENSSVVHFMTRKLGEERVECMLREFDNFTANAQDVLHNLIKLAGLFPAMVHKVGECVASGSKESPRACITEVARSYTDAIVNPELEVIVNSAMLILSIKGAPMTVLRCIVNAS